MCGSGDNGLIRQDPYCYRQGVVGWRKQRSILDDSECLRIRLVDKKANDLGSRYASVINQGYDLGLTL